MPGSKASTAGGSNNGNSFWRAGRARFAPPVDETMLPASLLERFGQSDAAERVVAALRYLAPVTAGAGSVMDS